MTRIVTYLTKNDSMIEDLIRCPRPSSAWPRVLIVGPDGHARRDKVIAARLGVGFIRSDGGTPDTDSFDGIIRGEN